MAKKRNKRRRRKGALGRLIRPLSVLLAAVAIVAALTMFFKVEQIEVTGNSRYSAEEIAAATGVEQGANLILLDKRGIAQRIYTELPYITEVHPHQKLPNTLQVEVTETRAIASIHGAGGYWLINDSGKLLELVEESKARDYLSIVGIDAESPSIGAPLALPEESSISRERLTELLDVLREQGLLARVDEVNVSDPETLVMDYDGRFRVEMYYNADFSFKLNCLTEAVALLEPNETGTIRMTMQNDNEARFIPGGR